MSVERQIRSNWALHAHDTQPAVDIYAKEVLQCFRVALTTRLERDAECFQLKLQMCSFVGDASQSSMTTARRRFVPLRTLFSLM